MLLVISEAEYDGGSKKYLEVELGCRKVGVPVFLRMLWPQLRILLNLILIFYFPNDIRQIKSPQDLVVTLMFTHLLV
jgi:hypothetical protein